MSPKQIFLAVCHQSPGNLPVFLHDWWLNAVAPDDWAVAVSLKGDQVVGVWPYVRTSRYTISMLRNPRLTPYLGPHVFFPPDIKPSNRDSFEHDVIADLLQQLPHADVWQLQPQPGLRQAGLFRHFGLDLGAHQTFLLDLKQGEDALFRNFKEPLRRNLKAGQDEYVISAEPAALGKLYEYQFRTLHRKRVQQPYTLEEVQQLMSAVQTQGAGTLWAARNRSGDIEALLWNVWDAERSYYYMGAKNPATESYRAMSILLWHCIREAVARGNALFDFEGSMDPGVERFFRNFGANRELYLVLRRNGHWLWKLARMIRR